MNRAAYQNLNGITIGHGHKKPIQKPKPKNKVVDTQNQQSSPSYQDYIKPKPANRPVLHPKF